MPTYRLHVEYDRGGRHFDLYGADFIDRDAALTEAHLGLRELLAAAIVGATDGPVAITLEDADGRHVATVARQEVVPPSWRSTY
ncbi:hypothetical protein RPMA_26880 [Tardiphaga alba]|uniref:DUF6894 domain-containing protein n=1 Tax=Tardiphaga alba TaxID=340268 RepID=A0ABX8AE56_9BRAD|nr:hypothetical protein [Tardiphaga alba]QUS42046.1 hypothetical protein RPMA_26880 [Tardiphaga alba]